uniref:neuropeptide FF receptor 1-like n=1 Tax=Myxine glutinosa TaxID=7769 RepID=UPI00358EEC3A
MVSKKVLVSGSSISSSNIVKKQQVQQQQPILHIFAEWIARVDLLNIPRIVDPNLLNIPRIADPRHTMESPVVPTTNVSSAEAEWSRARLSNISYLPFYQHSPPVAALLLLAYLFIFLLCMIGNGLVCFMVLHNHRMCTVTNAFILNLAVSDLLVGIFCMPITLIDNLIMAGWPFGAFTCKMSGLVQGMSVSASVFTLVAIAIDRFRCIVYPFKPKLSITKASCMTVVIWVLAASIMCPSAAMLTVVRVEDHVILYSNDLNDTAPVYSCREAWASKSLGRIYTTVLFVNIYLTPLVVIITLYTHIGLRLCSTIGFPGSHANRECEGRTTISKKKVKVIKMLIIVALLFMLSWLPLWTILMFLDYSVAENEHRDLINIYVFPFAHWLAFFNSSVNPIVYGYFNKNFRQGFQAAFKLRLCSTVLEQRATCAERIGPSSTAFPARFERARPGTQECTSTRPGTQECTSTRQGTQECTSTRSKNVQASSGNGSNSPGLGMPMGQLDKSAQSIKQTSENAHCSSVPDV